MPIARVQLPDGRVARLEVPEGTAPEQVTAFVEQQFAQQNSKAAQEPETYNPTDGMSTGQRFAAGAGKAVVDVGRGIGQMLGMVSSEEIAESRRLDAPLMDTGAGIAGNIGGNVAMAVLPGGVVGSAGRLAGSARVAQAGRSMMAPTTLPGATAQGAALGAVQPAETLAEKGASVGLGAAGGAGGQAIANTVGRVVRPVRSQLTPEIHQLAAAAHRRGIPLNAAQLTGSRSLKWADAALGDMPFVGGANQAAKEVQRRAFNRAVAETFGSTDDALTPQALTAARTRIGGEFNTLAGRNTLVADQQLGQDLMALRARLQADEIPDVGRIVENRLQGFLGKIDQNGQVAGTAYRKFDSDLGRRMRSTTNGDLRHALGDLRDTVRSAMDRSIAPADREAWQQARRQYGALMTVAEIAQKSPGGDVSPALLLAAVNRASGSAKFTGGGDLGELGRIGQAFLKEMPSSGTAQRTMWQNLMQHPLEGTARLATGAAGALPGYAMQSALYSGPGINYLTRGMIAPGPRVNALARSLRASAVTGGAAIPSALTE